MNGVDYSYGRPGGAALAAAGITFACRYLEYSHASGATLPKFLRTNEVADLHGHGIAIVANFESTALRPLDGKTAGIQDGYDAKVSLQALNAPDDLPIYFSCDFDFNAISAAEQDAVVAYFQGVGAVISLARAGAYGSLACINRLKATRSATYFWESAGHEGTPRKVSPFANIDQYQTGSMGAKPINGAAVDYDRALTADFGQWAPPPGGAIAQGENPLLAINSQVAGTATLIAGRQLYDLNGAALVTISVGGNVPSPFGTGNFRAVEITTGGVLQLALVKTTDTTFVPAPPPDCASAIAAAVAPLEAKIHAASAALA